MSCDVSVVIPTYNSSGTLKRALKSVYNQSSFPREIIVVDDGSDDWEESSLITSSYPDVISIRFVHLDKNQGVSAARNVGVSVALGRYVAFLDSDDVWYPNKLAVQYELMTRHHLDFSMHRYRDDMNRLGNERDDSPVLPPVPSSPLSLATLTPWTPLFRNDNTSTVMVLKEAMVPYDTSLRRGEDFKLYMELLAGRKCRGGYIERVMAGAFKSTLGVSGLSQDVKGMHLGRVVGLRKLINDGTISKAQYLFGICTEMMKYPIRIARISFRHRAAI